MGKQGKSIENKIDPSRVAQSLYSTSQTPGKWKKLYRRLSYHRLHDDVTTYVFTSMHLHKSATCSWDTTWEKFRVPTANSSRESVILFRKLFKLFFHHVKFSHRRWKGTSFFTNIVSKRFKKWRWKNENRTRQKRIRIVSTTTLSRVVLFLLPIYSKSKITILSDLWKRNL